MKKLLILTILVLNAGCMPLYVVDTALKQEEGWNCSGYVIKRKNTEMKMGSISSEILYDISSSNMSKHDKIMAEEAVKREGFILGIRFIKTF